MRDPADGAMANGEHLDGGDHPDPTAGLPFRRKPADRRFHGRRIGPGLSERQKRLLAEALPRFAIARDLLGGDGEVSPAAFFDRPHDRYALEIGFGKGEFLLARAMAEPDTGFIGAEPYLNGVVALVDAMLAAGVTNIRIHPDDARDLLERLRPASLDAVYLIHPDPWPKRRHAKRRFVNPENLDLVTRVLKPGGRFLVVSDDPVYQRWTAIVMANRADFSWTANGPADWLNPPPEWRETRYAGKAAAEGRRDVFFVYRRLPAA